LTRNDDVKRVRSEGQSYAHRSLILVVLSNQINQNRIAVIAGRSVGGAVQRNLAKRRIRSAIQSFFDDLPQGYDITLIARKSLLEIDYLTLVSALEELLIKAKLMKDRIS
jgi:ribonuclease P protein component